MLPCLAAVTCRQSCANKYLYYDLDLRYCAVGSTSAQGIYTNFNITEVFPAKPGAPAKYRINSLGIEASFSDYKYLSVNDACYIARVDGHTNAGVPSDANQYWSVEEVPHVGDAPSMYLFKSEGYMRTCPILYQTSDGNCNAKYAGLGRVDSIGIQNANAIQAYTWAIELGELMNCACACGSHMLAFVACCSQFVRQTSSVCRG